MKFAVPFYFYFLGIFATIGFVLNPSVYAQGVEFNFAVGFGGTGEELVGGVVVDDAGNIYTTGSFTDTVDFDPGPGITNLVSQGEEDIFVQKLDSSGNFLWAKSMGGTGEELAFSLALDNVGNICIAGSFETTVDFDPGVGATNFISQGLSDSFVLKLDGFGNLLWATSLGAGDWDAARGVAVDDTGHVYAVGFFRDIVDFDPGPGTFNIESDWYTDAFVQKLDSSGNFVWAVPLSGPSTQLATAVAVSGSGDVYVTGYFSTRADFDPRPGPDKYILWSGGGTDMFIWKLDSSGNFVWATKTDLRNYNQPFTIALDAAENVYTTGTFDNVIDFDPGPGVHNLSSRPGDDVYIRKLDASGNFVWARNMPSLQTSSGRGSGEGYGIAVDGVGNVYVAGEFIYTTDFDPGPGSFELTSVGYRNTFLSKLDVSGNLVWAKAMGAGGAQWEPRVAIDNLGNVYTVGHFLYTGDFDPGPGTVNLTSAGDTDIFVSKLSPVPSVVSVLRADPNPTMADFVRFTVAFSSPVTGVDTTDFSIDAVGVIGASVTGVSGSGDTYTVTVDTGDGPGTLSIDVVDDDTIVDVTYRPLGEVGTGNGDFSRGEAYTIETVGPWVTVDTTTTNDSTPALSGTVNDPDATISVTVDGQTNPATNNGTTWSLADNVLTILDAGIYDVQVSAMDLSGNPGSDITTNELTIQSLGLGGGGTITSNLFPIEMTPGVRLVLTATAGYTSYQWKKDGVELVDDPPRMTGCTTNQLVLDPLQLTDSGVYTCQFENGHQRTIVETEVFPMTVLLEVPIGSSWMLLCMGITVCWIARRKIVVHADRCNF